MTTSFKYDGDTRRLIAARTPIGEALGLPAWVAGGMALMTAAAAVLLGLVAQKSVGDAARPVLPIAIVGGVVVLALGGGRVWRVLAARRAVARWPEARLRAAEVGAAEHLSHLRRVLTDLERQIDEDGRGQGPAEEVPGPRTYRGASRPS